MKKLRGTMFGIVLIDFVSVFLALVLMLATIFLTFSYRNSRKDYLQYNQMLLKNLENRLDSYFDGISRSSAVILANGLLWDSVMRRGSNTELEEQLRILFSNLYYYSYHINSIQMYVPENDSIYAMDADVMVNNKKFCSSYSQTGGCEKQEWISCAVREQGVYQYRENDAGSLEVSVALSMPFSDDTAFVFQYTLSKSFWDELIRDIKTSQEILMIYNKSHGFFYCSDNGYQSFMPILQKRLEEMKDEEGDFSVHLEEKCLIAYSSPRDSDWVVMKAVPVRRLFLDFTTSVYLYGFCGIAAVGLVVYLSVIISRRVARPVEQLTRGLAGMTSDHFELDVNYTKQDEIGMLYQSCHEMVDMVNNLVKKEYQLNLSEKEARLKILQLQLNPHFIYNVLQLLSNIAVEAGNEEIEEITDAFGLLLRYNLANENRKVRVMEEIHALEQYFYIMKKTYGRRLEVEIQVEPEIGMNEMLPFILQPIIENAFRHGLSRKVGQMQIRVKGWLEEGCLVLSIRDNGIGIDEMTVEQLNDYEKKDYLTGDIVGGKGLSLIQNRIELEYGKPYGIHVESLFNIGTTVTVRLPDRKGDGTA